MKSDDELLSKPDDAIPCDRRDAIRKDYPVDKRSTSSIGHNLSEVSCIED